MNKVLLIGIIIGVLISGCCIKKYPTDNPQALKYQHEIANKADGND